MSTTAPPHRLVPHDRAASLRADYGVEGKLTPLPGENRNFLLVAADGCRFVLKLLPEDWPEEVLALEHAAAEQVAASGVGLAVPRTVPTVDGALAARWEVDGGVVRVRLVRWVEGRPWGEAPAAAPAQLRDLGRALAELDEALVGFSHPAAERTHRWDLTAVGQHRGAVGLVADADRRRWLEGAFQLWAASAAPRLGSLPRSFIHGDANDENVLVDGGRVVGLLDFGDAMVAPTVCELAVAVTYAMLDRAEPLAAGAEVVAGYHAVRPLADAELEVLFPLVCGRLAASVAVAAKRRRIDPERHGWFVTEERAWALLGRLAALDPVAGGQALAARLDLPPSPASGASPEELVERRRRRLGAALSLSFRQPLKIVRGAGAYLYDHRGRPYLDLVNNVCHVGHCHPRVVAAGQRQMALLNTNTRYLHDGLTEYAERLTATLPPPLSVVYLVSSGSEANELALRLAAAHTRRREVVVVDGAYHGHTGRLIELSPYKFLGPGGTGRPGPGVRVVPMPDGYRGPHKGQGREAGRAYGEAVRRVVAAAPSPVGCFLTESLLSCGGQIVPPAGYLETAFAAVRAAGGVCIADEVQVGFGRVGEAFWGFELQGAVPDVAVMGKPIGNGHPLAAVVATPEVAASFAGGMEFFSTYGGNPVSCAIGLAVLEVIEEEGLQENARRLGRLFLEGLRRLHEKHPLVGDVRGVGLFLGVELVRDRGTLEPAAEEATEVVERMKERGVLLATDGPLHNVLKIKPPMVLTADDVEMTLRALDDVLAALC